MKNFINMALSVGLAIAIVGGGIYLMSKSSQWAPAKAPTPILGNAMPGTQMNHPQTAMAPQTSAQASGQSPIIKCVVNGKTTYSDQPCANGIRQQQVELHDSNGIVSPNAATVQAARQRIQAEMQTEATAVSTTSTGKQADPFICSALSAEINSIDAATRNRLDAYEMQRLRIRREEVRTQQFRSGC